MSDQVYGANQTLLYYYDAHIRLGVGSDRMTMDWLDAMTDCPKVVATARVHIRFKGKSWEVKALYIFYSSAVEARMFRHRPTIHNHAILRSIQEIIKMQSHCFT